MRLERNNADVKMKKKLRDLCVIILGFEAYIIIIKFKYKTTLFFVFSVKFSLVQFWNGLP